MSIPLPSFTAFTNFLGDKLKHNAFSHCQLLVPSANDNTVLITTDGGCLSAFEIVGVNRYLTSATESHFLSDVDAALSSVLKAPHHIIGINYVRDQERTSLMLNDIFRATQDTIARLGLAANHFIDDQKRDLSKRCAFERTILTVTTKPDTTKRAKLDSDQLEIDGEKVVIAEIPVEQQNTLAESIDIEQTHISYCASLTQALSKEITVRSLTVDEYLLIVKEEEELTSLSQTGWRAKTIGDNIDVTTNNLDSEFVAYPPLAYQLVTSEKTAVKNEPSILYANNRFVATIDREYFPIDPVPFSSFISSIETHVPIRMSYMFETGTENIANMLGSKRSWLMFFLIAKQARQIDSSLETLIKYAEDDSGTLLSGHLSVATWASDLTKVKEYKRDIIQAMTAWGTQTVRTPTDTHKGYHATLPAYSNRPSARRCVQSLESHLCTTPITRPVAPMPTGGICMSSSDGRLFPINPTSSDQSYSLTSITGDMDSGKTVFSAVYNNTFLFGEGNDELPLIAYMDYGSGVHNYIKALRNWLPEHLHYKTELIQFNDVAGNALNLLEPQFGLDVLEGTERAFCAAFLTRVIKGSSVKEVHPKIADVIDTIINELFSTYRKNPKLYERRIGNYVKKEHQLHSEIEELLHSGDLGIDPNRLLSWYYVRDKLFDLGKDFFDHARFAHRQGSPALPELTTLCTQSMTLQSTFEAYTTDGGHSLLDYIVTSINGVIGRFSHIFALPSQIDVSQARIIGIDLKGITSESTDAESVNTRQMFGMLANHLATKNFWRDEETFMSVVPERYRDMYRRIVSVDMRIKKHWFIDEYRQIKSNEFDALIDGGSYIARKYNTCITIASQYIPHIPSGFFSVATNRYMLTLKKDEADILAQKFHLSQSFLSEAMSSLNRSDGFGRNVMYLGTFKSIKGLVVQILRNYITPSYLWNFASGAEDEYIKALTRARFGEKEAFQRLASRFPSGSAIKEIRTRLNNTRFNEKLTQEDVIVEMLQQLEKVRI
ncbi:hypothetical protein KW429_11140 [Vibrio fluvialis]|nr:hypothetical protein [Vibrio fluvialis]